jgi:hypothetical protein
VIRFARGPAALLGLAAASALLLVPPAPAPAGEPPAAPALRVEPDLRVELLSLIFRLAGNREYNQGRVDAYTRDVEARFGAFRDHEAVVEARRLRGARGASYDAVMSLAVHLKDAVSLEERIPFDPPPESLDARWRPDEARAFLEKARRFVKDAGFEAFAKEHEALFRLAADRLRGVLEKEAHVEWFEAFFGKRPGAVFTATFGMLNGGCCYGPHVRLTDGKEELYCVLGVWKTDADGKPDFDASILDTVAHEFAHSFANPLVDRFAQRLEKPGTAIYPLVAEAMKRQAYGNWLTMMRESLVRASVVRYLAKHQGPEAAAKQAREEAARSFLWVKDLADLLGEYEADRTKYPDLEAFIPRVADFFDALAPKLEKERAELGDKAPKIVSMTPANGAADVDPALDRITVVFDRPMADRAWSIVGGGPNFPEITGKPSYDETGKVWTVPVKLKPDGDYEFGLNSDRFTAFRSREGVPLQPVIVKFRTGGWR